MNQRGRERLEADIMGNGVVLETGERFSFFAMDFTHLGMQVKMQGIDPVAGQKIQLEFELTDDRKRPIKVSLKGQVMRLIQEDGENFCGVKWADGESPEMLETLEGYYVDKFFDTIR